MALTTMEPLIGRVDDEEEEKDLVGDDSDGGGEVGEVRKRVSRLAVEGGGADVSKARGREQGAYRSGGGGGGSVWSMRQNEDVGVWGRRFSGPVGGWTLPPPHAWLVVEDTKKSYASDPEEQWMRVLGGGAPQRPQRRSSFSVVRREREAWLDRAWEMKKSWHERNGGAPDADTPVVVVVGKGPPSSSSPPSQAAGSVGGGGVAMDMEEVRACRDLGLELPSDCTVEIQCYGLSAGSGPTHTASSDGDSPSAGTCFISSPGEDPMDVKARLKVWAHAVALESTTHLGS